MMHNRLDGVLNRNRKNILLDLALAALFPMALLLSGMAVGAEIPKLASAPQAAPAIIAQIQSADV
jgi:hypothetical protein